MTGARPSSSSLTTRHWPLGRKSSFEWKTAGWRAYEDQIRGAKTDQVNGRGRDSALWIRIRPCGVWRRIKSVGEASGRRWARIPGVPALSHASRCHHSCGRAAQRRRGKRPAAEWRRGKRRVAEWRTSWWTQLLIRQGSQGVPLSHPGWRPARRRTRRRIRQLYWLRRSSRW